MSANTSYNPDILPRGEEWSRIWFTGPGCAERVNCWFGLTGPCLNPKHGASGAPGNYTEGADDAE